MWSYSIITSIGWAKAHYSIFSLPQSGGLPPILHPLRPPRRAVAASGEEALHRHVLVQRLLVQPERPDHHRLPLRRGGRHQTWKPRQRLAQHPPVIERDPHRVLVEPLLTGRKAHAGPYLPVMPDARCVPRKHIINPS